MTLSSGYRCAPLVTIALLAPAFMVSSATAADTGSQAFEFRGARLGMSVEEFEALPALGTARLSEYGPKGKKLREGLLTRCAPDKDKINNQLGVVECSRAGDDPFTPQQYRYAYTAISYKFGPDASGVKRLFLSSLSRPAITMPKRCPASVRNGEMARRLSQRRPTDLGSLCQKPQRPGGSRMV
jgi:hypothetical protein